MPETISIPVADLLINSDNPRIANQNLGQREALRALAQIQSGYKLLALAEDIVSRRSLSPAELLITTPSTDEPGRYMVLEGNRRLATLRALESPGWLENAVSQNVLERMRKLSAQYQQDPIKTVQCVVMDRGEAEHWIDLRHTGENRGAGIVEWGPDEKARFRSRSRGVLKLHTRLLDFLQEGGHLSAAERQRVPTTTFERLVNSPAVRGKIGIEAQKGGQVRFLADENRVVKALMYIVRDLANRNTKVHHVYTKEQREDYASRFPAHLVATISAKSSAGGVT